MAEVTIEGSATPCVELARGVRRTVQLTDRVQALIDRGFVIVVDSAPTARHAAPEPVAVEPEPEPVVAAESEHSRVPSRAASADTWRAFLAEEHVDFPADAGRDALIGVWERYADEHPEA